MICFLSRTGGADNAEKEYPSRDISGRNCGSVSWERGDHESQDKWNKFSSGVFLNRTRQREVIWAVVYYMAHKVIKIPLAQIKST
ncbi:hypothetical protein U1Q18_041372 [Sarracenia purpurea var. burkii]